jgi:hypothetical protein
VAYQVGDWTALALGAMRMSYAIGAKIASTLWRASVTMASAEAAVAGRDSLKFIARLGLFPNTGMMTMAEAEFRYGADAAKIIAKAGQTDMRLNVAGGVGYAGGLFNWALCECGD